jgi:DNA-binding transcriptional LysR family regulator
VTQSAVSRAIAALERRLGGPLVHRGPDGASLTALGRQVAEHARAVIEHLHTIETLGRNQDAPQLRVGAVASALVRLVPDALARLRRDWPAGRVLTVHGEDDELAAWLAADTIDLAVTTQPREEADSCAAAEAQLERPGSWQRAAGLRGRQDAAGAAASATPHNGPVPLGQRDASRRAAARRSGPLPHRVLVASLNSPLTAS